MLGPAVPDPPKKPMRCEIRGVHDEEVMLGISSECDAGLVLYWFEKELYDAARLSFPTKLSSYLAAGLPIAYVGPPETAVERFVRERGIGVACTSSDPEAIEDLLRSLCDSTTCAARAEGITRVLETELGGEVFVERIRRLVGVA